VKTDIDNLRLNWRDEDGSAQFASPLRTAAAVYIAELEAELGNEDYETLKLRLEKAEAERDHYFNVLCGVQTELAAERIDGQHWVEAVSLRDKMLRLFMLSHVPRLDGEENDEWFDRLRVETEILRARAEEGGGDE